MLLSQVWRNQTFASARPIIWLWSHPDRSISAKTARCWIKSRSCITPCRRCTLMKSIFRSICLESRLAAPVLVAGMTGRHAAGRAINKDSSCAVQTLGLGFGLGSQRAMALHPDLAWTYQVRKLCRTCCCWPTWDGTARQMSTDAVRSLMKQSRLMPCAFTSIQRWSLVQIDGDRDFPRRRRDARPIVQRIGQTHHCQGNRVRYLPQSRADRARRASLESTCRVRRHQLGRR